MSLRSLCTAAMLMLAVAGAAVIAQEGPKTDDAYIGNASRVLAESTRRLEFLICC